MTSFSIFAIGQTSLRGSLTPKDLNTSDTFCDEPLIEILSPLEIEDRLKFSTKFCGTPSFQLFE
jgi:hypothetical protein